jgi:hypothetical protein
MPHLIGLVSRHAFLFEIEHEIDLHEESLLDKWFPKIIERMIENGMMVIHGVNEEGELDYGVSEKLSFGKADHEVSIIVKDVLKNEL